MVTTKLVTGTSWDAGGPAKKTLRRSRAWQERRAQKEFKKGCGLIVRDVTMGRGLWIGLARPTKVQRLDWAWIRTGRPTMGQEWAGPWWDKMGWPMMGQPMGRPTLARGLDSPGLQAGPVQPMYRVAHGLG
ncbi:hypothetical protein TorRG33x02_098470 [Trema orientale]|uniref:Uncharacterized protein n=1 Tax=Trema orientale TaxID=63057 RepID=A0A2P5F9B2_TREOI|nr:hypothetical protein TorRG33x02_098470 [Trema orientale]